jgi:hypothetical protein
MYTNNLDVWIGLLLVANSPNRVVKKTVLALMKNAHPYTVRGILTRILNARMMGKEIVKAAQGLEETDEEIRSFVHDGYDGFVQIVYGGKPEFFPFRITVSSADDEKWALANENTIRLTIADIVMRKIGVKQLTARVFLFSEGGWSGLHEDVTVIDEHKPK